MDAHNFEKCFEKILTKVEPGSVIVLDTAPYHSRLVDRVPNMSWRKADIQAWLQNYAYDENEIKAQLLTKFNKSRFNKKVVDEMAARKNISVLRLPPYHCELNPIELIWAQLKSYVGRNNISFKLAEIKELIIEGLNQIGTVSWIYCFRACEKRRRKMMQLDGILDTASEVTPSFVIEVTSENSVDDDEDDTDVGD